MVQIYERKDATKLVAAILALTMLVVGVTVLTSDNGVDAVDVTDDGFTTAARDGTYEITDANTNIVLTSTVDTTTITGESLTFALSGISSAVVTISMTISDDVTDKIMFNGIGITVPKGVTLILNLDSTIQLADDASCHIIVDGDLNIQNGGTVQFRQSATAPGVSYWNAGTQNLMIESGASLIIDGANGLSGVAADVDGSIQVNSVTSSPASMTFATGSNFASTSTVTVNDSDAVVSFMGTGITVDGEINASSSVVRIYPGTDVTVNGQLNAQNIRYMTSSTGGETGTIEVGESGRINAGTVATTFDEVEAAFETQDEVTLQSDVPVYLGGNGFVIPSDKTLNIVGTTIYAGTAGNEPSTQAVNLNGQDIIVVTGSLVLDDAYVYCGVYVDEDVGGMVTVNNPHILSSTGTLNDSTRVGYGDTFTLSGTVPGNVTVDVYGTLNASDVTVNGTVNTYVGSTVNLTGTVTIAKTFTLSPGATMDIAGTVNVRNDSDGGATFTLALPVKITYDVPGSSAGQTQEKNVNLIPSVTVAEDGTFNVNRPTSNTASRVNTLSISSGADFIVEGTLNITGSLSGIVQNKGTMTFNGTAVGNASGVVLYDGVSMTVNSVTGILTIGDTDNVIYDYLGLTSEQVTAAGYVISAGNYVTLTGVRNVTVGVTVSDYYDNDAEKTYYKTDLTVSGAITSTVNNGTGELSIVNESPSYSANDTTVQGSVTIVDTLSVGTGITVSTLGNVTVAGEVNVIAQNSTFNNMNSGDSGYLTVDGTITVATTTQGVSFTAGNINAVTYTVTDAEANITSYYTSFANAIDEIANAQDQTVTVLGTVAVSADDEVPAGATVVVNGALNINLDVTLTVAAGGYLSNSGHVYVLGTLVINDHNTGLTGNLNNVHYDVYTLVDPVATYTSLVNALSNAQSGETITLSQPVNLKTSITIPEGVTLQTGRNAINVFDGVTITVNGTLAVQNGGSIAKGESDLVWGDDIRIVVNNVMSVAGSTVADIDDYLVSGAYYESRGTAYVTSVAYASENVHSGTITIMGQVSAGDVSFTADNNRTLNVTVAAFDPTSITGVIPLPKTTVTAGTITIADGVSINLTAGEFTGTITGPVADGTASVQFAAASGVNVVSDTDATGATAYMYVNGTVTGSMTIASGIATVGGTTSATLSSTDTDSVRGSITVASGATLVVPAGTTVTANGNQVEGATVTVDGTIQVIGTLAVSTGATATVSGTVNIAQDNNSGAATLSIAGILNVTGTVFADGENGGDISISSSNDNTGTLVVGAKPTILGTATTGTVSGPATVDGLIKVYNGASVSGMTISDVAIDDVTSIYNVAYYINGTLYMSAYTDDSNTAALGANSPIGGDYVSDVVGLQLTGLNTTGVNVVTNWFTDADMTMPVSSSGITFATADTLYYDAPVSNVTGTISAGTGLVIYLDGVAQTSGNNIQVGYGSHVVTIDVKVGYDGSNAVITFNGQTVQNGATIEITEGGFTLTATGAVPADFTGGSSGSSDDGMGLTDYLLIILVVLIVIMAIMVAMRLMRS